MRIPQFKANLISGLTIALISFPLAVGLSQASGFPPQAGIIATVIAGMFCSFKNICPTSINGPAAGLSVTLFMATQQFGLQSTMAGCLISSLLVFLTSKTKAIQRIEKLPQEITNGMLSAIGLSLLIKNLPFAIGFHQGTFQFQAFFLSLATLISILAFKIKKNRLPLSLFILFIGMCFAPFLSPHFFLQEPSLNFTANTRFQFHSLENPFFLGFIIQLALIQIIETSITLKKFFPHEKNRYQDLSTVGISSFLSCLIGGLPIIVEPIRTKLNQEFGATHQSANFIQAAGVLLFSLTGLFLLKLIPQISFAYILMIVGIKLLKSFKIFKVKKPLLLFITCFTCFQFNLLIGVLFGFFFHQLSQTAFFLKLNPFKE
jgi:carbonic anhydrase